MRQHCCTVLVWSLETTCCTFAGVLRGAAKHEGSGHYTAEVCCKQAGMVTVVASLNEKPIGHPLTLPVVAKKPCQLQQVQQGVMCCTAGLAPVLLLCDLHTWACDI